MSDVATKVDAKAELANWTRRLTGMFAADLKAIAESSYTICPGGKCRTVAEFTSEVVGFNFMVSNLLKGQPAPMPSDEERAAFASKFTTTDFCVQSIKDSGEALASAIEAATEESMAEPVTMPWGETMSKWAMANLTANHILYHDGQLNYIQSLNGDAEMHWFDA